MNSVDPGMKYQVFEMSHSLGNEIKVSKSNLEDFINFARFAILMLIMSIHSGLPYTFLTTAPTTLHQIA